MVEEIFALVKELTGAAEREEPLLRALCEAAEAEVRRGRDVEACRSACLCAASWLAAADLLTGRMAAGETGSWRVGEVSFTGGQSGAAEALRRQAWQLLAETGGGVVLRGVKG